VRVKHTVVVANGSAAEAQAVIAALGARYAARAVTAAEALAAHAEEALAVVLDANFTPSGGSDALAALLSRVQVPVLMVTPPGQPRTAVQALRCGAAAYLVKSDDYLSLIGTALDEVIQRADHVEDLRRAVVALRRRVIELERRLAAEDKEAEELRLERVAAEGGAVAVPLRRRSGAARAAERRARLKEELARRLASPHTALHAYPRIATRFRELAARPDATTGEVARLLAQDAAVSARLLRLANSPYYRRAADVHSVEQAVERLGIVTVGNMVELLANRSLYAGASAPWRPRFDELWRRSLSCAVAARAAARALEHPSPERLFSLGLLHGAGELLLLQASAELDPEGETLRDAAEAREFDALVRRERGRLGAALLQLWGFDAAYQEVALYAEDPARAAAVTRELLIVAVARAVPDHDPVHAEAVAHLPAARFLGLEPSAVVALAAQTQAEVQACTAALGSA